jgi:hypothetical protein
MTGHIDERSIALLAGDDLEPRRKAEIIKHLLECITCRRMLDAYQEERECLAQLKEQSVTAYDCASLSRSILFIESRRTQSTGASLRWAVSGAALLIMAITSLMVWNRISTQNPTEQTPHLAQYSPTAKQPEIGPAKSENLAERIYRPKQKPKKSWDASEQKNPGAPVERIPVAVESQVQADTSDEGDDIVIRLETENPNVSIFWLASR